MKKLFSVSLCLVMLGFAGCATTGKIAESDQVKISVLETIPKGSQPDWVSDGKDFYKKDGNMFYVAVSEGFNNLEASKRASFASAQTKVAEQVKNTIGVEFGRSLETGMYEDNTGGYLKDVFMSNVSKINISGVTAESTYSEKIQEQKGSDSKVYYRTYTLVSIPEKTYQELVKRAFDTTAEQVKQNESAKKILAEAENRFYNKKDKQEIKQEEISSAVPAAEPAK